MASKLDDNDEGFNDINITPFVDVVLVLLVMVNIISQLNMVVGYRIL